MATQLSLLGTVDSSVQHALTVNRLTGASQLAVPYETTETVWERGTATPVSDENRLRIRKTRLPSSPTDAVSFHVHQKPESARLSSSPDLLSRSVIELSIAEHGGDPSALVSAFGYVEKFTFHQRGLRFQRGTVLAEVYQLYSTASSDSPIHPESWIVSISTTCPRTAIAGGPSAQDLRSKAVEAMREIASLLRGAVDLSRVE